MKKNATPTLCMVLKGYSVMDIIHIYSSQKRNIRLKHLSIIFLSTLILFLSAFHALASDTNPEKQTNNYTSAEAVVAKMSYEQVRHLLIEELRKETLTQLAPAKKDGGAFGELIEDVRNKISLIHKRIAFLNSGENSNTTQIGGIFVHFKKDEYFSTQAILSVFILFIVAFGIELLFHWYSAPFRGRIQNGIPIALQNQIGRHVLRAFIDVISIAIFIIAVLVCGYIFFEPTPAHRILTATYLSAIVAIRIALIVARFFLSPKDPSSRFLPITNSNALFLYRWIIAISIFTCLGLMSSGIMKLAGASDAMYIKSVLILDLTIAAMLIAMILQKRQEVAVSLSAKFPVESHPANLVQKWHHIAIFFVFLLLITHGTNLLLGNYSGYLSIKTLLMVPFYFLMDWILRRILETVYEFIPEDEDTINVEKPHNDADIEASDEPAKESILKRVEFSRLKKIIVSSLRFALLALFLVWTLNIWGIELPIGKAVIKAVLNILVVVLLCYVVWEFLNVIIKRRLKLEMPDKEEEMEEGGAGGSRIGTLLQLFRKFLMIFLLIMAVMVTLSAMGVNIGPLIAGAGVFGLAIGFGAQTLVKDIISGVFFLIDDAFRLGDYIQIGSAKGSVESISIRSLSLRHPRGMVNSLSFGEITSVKNFSRDYIITKLDFRVRYDTDVEKVRKLIKKKVHKVILKNEELSSKLLSKIKSQGVRQMDDSAMVMRVKYKTKPGDQFMIRKEVYRLLQEAFKEEGIEFAHKNVTVYIPPESSQHLDTKDNDVQKKIIEAGAAATLAEEEPPKQE